MLLRIILAHSILVLVSDHDNETYILSELSPHREFVDKCICIILKFSISSNISKHNILIDSSNAYTLPIISVTMAE